MINDKVYRFKIVANYDDGVIGASSLILEDVKTKFLICEDITEIADPSLPNSGYKYLVARPSYLWNATPPKNYFDRTDSLGIFPLRPTYALNDIIQVLSCFEQDIHPAYDLLAGTAGIAADLKSYILGLTGPEVMNFGEIDNEIIKCYFVDINVDARTRELGGGGICVPVIPITPYEIFPAPPGGAKTAIVTVDGKNVPYYCVESTQVWFQDVVKVVLNDRFEIFNISSEFVKSCEDGSIYVSSFTSERAATLGIKVVDGNTIVIDNPSKIATSAYVTLNGIRKDCNIEKFISVDNNTMAKNSEFWEKWKKA